MAPSMFTTLAIMDSSHKLNHHSRRWGRSWPGVYLWKNLVIFWVINFFDPPPFFTAWKAILREVPFLYLKTERTHITPKPLVYYLEQCIKFTAPPFTCIRCGGCRKMAFHKVK